MQGDRWQISTTGGTRAAWARSGRELFYLDKDGMLTSVSVQAAGTSFSAGVPVRILNTSYYSGATTLDLDLRAYDVAPDGQRFVMIKENDGGQTSKLASMVVVMNWVEELKARLPRHDQRCENGSSANHEPLIVPTVLTDRSRSRKHAGLRSA